MKEEFEQNQPNPEGTPGGLGNAFEGYSPELPAGSWERLADRRKKRRRGLAWWWLSGVFLAGVIGFSILTSLEEDGLQGSQKQHVSTKVPVEGEVHQDPSEVKQNSAGSAAGSSASESGQTAHSEGQIPVSDAKEETAAIREGTREQFNAQKNPAARSEAQPAERETERTTPTESSKETSHFSSSQKRKNKALISASRLARVTTPFAGNPVRNQTAYTEGTAGARPTVQKGAQNPSVKSPIKAESTPENLQTKGQSTSHSLASSPTTGLQSAEDSGKDRNEAKKPSSTSLLSNPDPVTNHGLTGTGTASDSTHKPGADSLSSPNKSNEAQAKTDPDSTRPKLVSKRTWRLEAGVVGLTVSQQIRFQEPDSRGATVLEPVNIHPMWGGNLHLRVEIPVFRKWSVLPFVQYTFLNQTIDYVENPGQEAPVKLTKTNEGIVGIPRTAGRSFEEVRWLQQAGAGLEIDHRFSEKFSVRAGFRMSRPLGNPNSQPRPLFPVYQIGCMYQWRKSWFVRPEISYGTDKGALPFSESTSQSLQMGVGLVWRWK